MITESDELARALEAAQRVWPELAADRAGLLRKIIETGVEGIDSRLQQQANERLAAVESAAGALSGAWPTNWRQELDDEWPS